MAVNCINSQFHSFPVDSPPKDSTQRAIGPTVVIGQIIGLLPVKNVLNYSAAANGLSFKWLCPKSVLAAALIFLSCIELCCAIRRFIRMGFSLGGFTVIAFYFSTTSTAVLMFRLAVSGRFKQLMETFENMEEIFDSDLYRIPNNKWTLRRKIITLTCIVAPLAIVEHLFYLLAKMTNVWSQIKKCKFNISLYEHFLRTERRHLYVVIPFNYFIAIPFEITNLCNTFAWTFLDLTIMIFSIALAHRFQQISRRIKRVLLQVRGSGFCLRLLGLK